MRVTRLTLMKAVLISVFVGERRGSEGLTRDPPKHTHTQNGALKYKVPVAKKPVLLYH